jgi:hypothetical protein
VTLTAPTRSTRSPLAVRAGAALLVLTAAASTVGLVLFGVVWADDPLGPGAVFTAFMLAAAATALAAVPALLRGSALGWALTFGWGCCYTYWSVYKVFGEEEFESLGFLAAGTGIVALLATRAARAHAKIAR